MNINKLQNELLYNIQFYKNEFITIFNEIINKKTGENFVSSIENNNYIFLNNISLQQIIYSHNNDKWYLVDNNNTILFENNNLIEVINYYLIISNRLTLCIYLDNNIDMEIEELCNKINYTKI